MQFSLIPLLFIVIVIIVIVIVIIIIIDYLPIVGAMGYWNDQ